MLSLTFDGKIIFNKKRIANKELADILGKFLMEFIPRYITTNGNSLPEYIKIVKDEDGSICSKVKYENSYGRNGVSTDYLDNYSEDIFIENILMYIFENKIKLKPIGHF